MLVTMVAAAVCCLSVNNGVALGGGFGKERCSLPSPIGQSLEKQAVTVHINGELREVPEGLTLAALIEWLKLPRDRVAVERNLEIVPRARWNVTSIQAGDQLEVVHLVGGGM